MFLRIIFLIVSVLGEYNCVFSQGTWTQKANFGGTARWEAVGFSIGNKGYIGTGYDGSYKNDLWEYNPITDSWTQMASLPGTARHSSACFSIGNKEYVGTGFSPASLADFWEWDQTNNSWIQKANYSPGIRDDCFAFSVGSKGYFGGGSVWNTSSYYSDFWEYDPITNGWTQKANFPVGNRAEAVTFTIGNKGYVGTGYDGYTKFNDFWEYDPVANNWNAKMNFPGTARYKAVGFSICNKGYIGTGNDGLNKQDFWEWDQSTNLWTQNANFPGGIREDAAAFSIGNKGYIGTGSNGSNFNDFWEFTPANACNTITVTVTSQNILCNAQCTGAGTVNPVNGTSPYTYNWSNGQTTQTTTGLCAGTYSVLVTDASSATTTATVTITQLSALSLTIISSPTVSSGNTGTATVSVSGGTIGYTYLWNPSGQTTSTATNLGVGTYCVRVTDSNGCYDSSCVAIKENIICETIFLPNAFSPNDDNENDILLLQGTQCVKTFSLYIYNRWGENVFETTDVTKGWDGTFNDKKESSAVFTYYLEGTYFSGNEFKKKGNISIVR